MIQAFVTSSSGTLTFAEALQQISTSLLIGGWLFVLFLILWLAWEAYKLLKMIDYVSAIEWTFLQITLPETAEQTPKAMETAISVWAGIHKGPDLVERFFEGYLEAWYSLEVQCEPGRARYILVVPTAHRRFFEGVIYGQYPTAEVREVEDYTQPYRWQDIGKTFDLYGTELNLQKEDIYPIRTWLEYEDALAPEERFMDPHQSLIEAYTNVGPGEQYWLQIVVRPIDSVDTEKWAEAGEDAVAEISGQKKEKPKKLLQQMTDFAKQIPSELLQAFMTGPVEIEREDQKPQLRFFNPVDEAKMKAISQKVSREAYRVKIRVIYIAPVGQLHKPSIGRAIGVFKQFNTFNLNSFLPDPVTKTNGPNYFMKAYRRRYRERKILLFYQWRDHWGYSSGYMLTAEEIATLYHFPTLWIKAPVVERAKAGLQAAPENLPYV